MVDDMYVVLRQIFEEYYDIFQFDSFHFGGDEVCILLKNNLSRKHIFFINFLYNKNQVDFRCWESEEAVTKPMEDGGISIDTDGMSNIILILLCIANA